MFETKKLYCLEKNALTDQTQTTLIWFVSIMILFKKLIESNQTTYFLSYGYDDF